MALYACLWVGGLHCADLSPVWWCGSMVPVGELSAQGLGRAGVHVPAFDALLDGDAVGGIGVHTELDAAFGRAHDRTPLDAEHAAGGAHVAGDRERVVGGEDLCVDVVCACGAGGEFAPCLEGGAGWYVDAESCAGCRGGEVLEGAEELEQDHAAGGCGDRGAGDGFFAAGGGVGGEVAGCCGKVRHGATPI